MRPYVRTRPFLHDEPWPSAACIAICLDLFRCASLSGRGLGVLFDNTWRTFFDFGREVPGLRPKIKLEKVENFQRSNKRHLRTTIHHAITTNPPANYHQKTRDFPDPPPKNAHKSAKIRASVPRNFFVEFEPQKGVAFVSFRPEPIDEIQSFHLTRS